LPPRSIIFLQTAKTVGSPHGEQATTPLRS
jgi:hypothetical protein